MERKTSLDLIRSVAILAVLLLHMIDLTPDLNYQLKYLFSYGWIGVDLFFVLSGFLIGSQAFSETNPNPIPSTINFWIKRWTRTLPLYFVVLFVYVFLKPLITNSSFKNDLLPYIFLFQNYTFPQDFVQSWSLCIEEQFYLFFPILFFVFSLKKLSKWIWIIPGLISFILRYHYYYNLNIPSDTLPSTAYNYQFPLHTHLDGISYGLILAAYKDQWSKWGAKNLILSIGIILLIGTLTYIGPTNTNEKVVLSFHALAISFSLILIGIYHREIKFGKEFFYKTSIWSYGIYLWNNLIVKVLMKINFIQNSYIKVSLFFILTYLISYLTYELIEKNGMKIRNLLIKKKA